MGTNTVLPRGALLGIKKMLENGMDHQFIADTQNVSIKAVDDIAAGRSHTWFFGGVKYE